MKLDFLRPLYDRRPPFVSVYLDTGRATEDALTAIDLRWRGLSERLAGQGAAPGELAPIAALVSDPGRAAPGRAVFEAEGDVVYSEPLPVPPRREIAHRGPLPHVMPLLTQRRESVPHVRVVVDHAGADIVTAGREAVRERTVAAEAWPVHKTGVGGWSTRRYDSSVEETWEHNAAAAAKAVTEEARRVGAELVVVAGEARSRPMLIEHLDKDAAERVVVVERGSRAPGAAPEPFAAEVETAIDDWLAARRAERLDAYRAGPSVTGLDAVARALREGRVDTMFLVDDPSSTATMWIGPEGTQLAVDRDELVAWGVAEPIRERADAALARALALTDAELCLVREDELDAPDGVAALLRY